MEPAFKCPKCGDSSRIDVTITTDARLILDEDGELCGTDPFEAQNGDHEWDCDSDAHCVSCQYYGKVAEFDTKIEKEEADV